MKKNKITVVCIKTDNESLIIKDQIYTLTRDKIDKGYNFINSKYKIDNMPDFLFPSWFTIKIPILSKNIKVL